MRENPGLFHDADMVDIWQIQSQHLVECCVHLVTIHLYPFSWASTNMTAVSHSSTEAEVISLDTGVRKEGLLALTVWDIVTDLLEPPASRARADPWVSIKIPTSQTTQETIDYISPNAQESCGRAHLFIFEDNEAVIKMLIKGRSPLMRHVSRTDGTNLDRLFERINLDSNISVTCVR